MHSFKNRWLSFVDERELLLPGEFVTSGTSLRFITVRQRAIRYALHEGRRICDSGILALNSPQKYQVLKYAEDPRDVGTSLLRLK